MEFLEESRKKCRLEADQESLEELKMKFRKELYKKCLKKLGNKL